MFSSLIIVVAVVLASCSKMALAQCACDISSGYYAVCNDTSITSIPDCVPSNFTLIEIDTPSIPLVSETISRFTNLTGLYIANFDNPQISTTFLSGHPDIYTFLISETNLEYVDNEWFQFSPGIRDLYLNFNEIASLAADTFSSLPLLESLYLDDNQLTTLPPTLFQGTALKYLYLENNPWHCDCELATLMQWVRDNGVNVGDGAYCKYPKEFEGLELMYLTPEVAC